MPRTAKMTAISLCVALAAGLPVDFCVCSAASSGVWDLSYRTLLKANGVESGEWIQHWLATEKGPPEKELLRRIKDGGVRSAVLIEYPAFHAGERLTWLLVASTKGARCWNFVQGKPGEHVGTPLDPKALDILVEKLLAWKQAPPLPAEGAQNGEPGGYFAFLSVLKATESRQMLLTLNDFKVPLDPEWNDAKPGRVYDVFGPVIGLYE